MNISTEHPIKVVESNLYLLVIEIQDETKTQHFWLLNGQYDGYCRTVGNNREMRQINEEQS